MMKTKTQKNSYARKWYKDNYDRTKDHLNLLRRERYKADHEFRQKVLFYNAARRYHISVELYSELVSLHKGLCAVCGQGCKSGRCLAVDHDHVTGAIRGLLCVKCNSGLGQFDDNPERLRAAADYLERAYVPRQKG